MLLGSGRPAAVAAQVSAASRPPPTHAFGHEHAEDARTNSRTAAVARRPRCQFVRCSSARSCRTGLPEAPSASARCHQARVRGRPPPCRQKREALLGCARPGNALVVGAGTRHCTSARPGLSTSPSAIGGRILAPHHSGAIRRVPGVPRSVIKNVALHRHRADTDKRMPACRSLLTGLRR